MEKSAHSARVVDLVRTVTFSAAHRYFDSHISDEENRQTYGSLYREKGFGHNFLLEAYFTGEVDPLTGMVLSLSLIDGWLREVALLLDHQHLNRLAYFAGRAPTPERIARFAFTEIAKRLQAWQPEESSQNPLHSERRRVRLSRVRLHEGERLWVDVHPR